MNQDVTTLKVWSTKQMATILFFTVTAVFSITMIYARFIYMEQQIEILNDRLEKKTKRLETDNENQWSVINELQKK